jgi:hypothetical protein
LYCKLIRKSNDRLTCKNLQPSLHRIYPTKQFQACTDFKMERNIKKLNLYSKEYKNMVWDNFLVVNLSFLIINAKHSAVPPLTLWNTSIPHVLPTWGGYSQIIFRGRKQVGEIILLKKKMWTTCSTYKTNMINSLSL